MSLSATARQTNAKVAASAKRAAPWLALFVRAGYAAKGVLYAYIGLLAAMAALGKGGKLANQRGAMDTLAVHPVGPPLLYAMAIGLAAYSTWRVSAAIFRPEGEEVLRRVGYLVSAAVYYALAFAAFEAARGTEGASSYQRWVGMIETPPGRVAAVVGGVGFMAAALIQAIQAVQLKFMERFETAEMSQAEKRLAKVSGIVGIESRSVVFAVAAWLFVRAGFNENPTEAGGLSKSMKVISLGPGGHTALLAVAFGLIAYGCFMFVQARFRRIETA